VPLTVSTVPLAMPLQTGHLGSELLHNAPGAVVVMERVMPDEVEPR